MIVEKSEEESVDETTAAAARSEPSGKRKQQPSVNRETAPGMGDVDKSDRTRDAEVTAIEQLWGET